MHTSMEFQFVKRRRTGDNAYALAASQSSHILLVVQVVVSVLTKDIITLHHEETQKQVKDDRCGNGKKWNRETKIKIRQGPCHKRTHDNPDEKRDSHQK